MKKLIAIAILLVTVNAYADVTSIESKNLIDLVKSVNPMTDEVNYFISIFSTEGKAMITCTEKSIYLRTERTNMDVNNNFVEVIVRFDKHQQISLNMFTGDHSLTNLAALYSDNSKFNLMLNRLKTSKKVLIKPNLYRSAAIYEFDLVGFTTLYNKMLTLNSQLSEIDAATQAHEKARIKVSTAKANK